ncbi:3-isopropylmalate dehydrogenase [Blattabacterium cuenoti]|uniref:3-isopropylmalate dehydrogenase n=1 Tax=Blattabacterium cuenoti TaxID=1653831 RepID=UPI00163D1B6D|nr:3-isopropylmalate dehydrogenase [Blattabacterium cuenoti]
MKKNIVVMEGDGIGPEVIKQTLKVLNSIQNRFDHDFSYKKVLSGVKSIEKLGDPMPKKTLKECLKSDAILLGSIGDPKYDHYNTRRGMRPEDGLLKLRKEMGLYCNIRPIINYSIIDKSPIKKEKLKGINFVIYRELTGGIYFGKKGVYINERNEKVAYDHCIYSTKEIERIGKKAFEAARMRRKKITLVDKANVLETSRLWREVIKRIGLSCYPDVKLEFLYIDHAIMKILLNPIKFDVILTDNMFGDILSDGASVITGSLGLLPSASIGKNNSLFEPVHGSYPEAKGKNIANPLGSILSASMMLEHFGLNKEKKIVEKAVKSSMEEKICTSDLMTNEKCSYTTEEVGDYIEKYIKIHC